MIALAIIAAGVHGVDAWVARGWRFRIRDALLVVAVVSLGLGWRNWHIDQKRREVQVYQDLYLHNLTDASPALLLTQRYGQPPPQHDSAEWLTRLSGAPSLLPWRRHETTGEIYGGDLSRMSNQDWDALGQLHYLRTLRLHSSPIASVLEQARLPRSIRNLAIINSRTHPNRVVENPRKMADERIDLSPLIRLPRLEQLRISCPLVLIEDLTPLLQCPALELVAIDISASQAEVDAFITDRQPRFELRRSAANDSYGTPGEPNSRNLIRVRLARIMADGAIGRPDLAVKDKWDRP